MLFTPRGGVSLDAFFVGQVQSFSVGGTFLLREAAAIPEPTTMLLLGTGLAGIGGMIRRRRQGKTE
jgi:hypothetical protein